MNNIAEIAAFSLLIILLFAFLIYLYKYNKIKKGFDRLIRSFNELDEQAKLILRTDLDLNKAQEELDRRLNGLDALQKTSRLINTTLDEKEIFRLLNRPLLTELGFEQYLIFIFSKDKTLIPSFHFGIDDDKLEGIVRQVQNSSLLPDLLNKKNTISSNTEPEENYKHLKTIFHSRNFVIAPIMIQNDRFGFIFSGGLTKTSTVTDGDEELVSILADQIGQAIENARLFEQAYRSSQQLELKVQDRTRQLSSLLEEVQKVSKTKSEFISAVSHELRTPLTSIKGYASLLMTGKIGEIPEPVKDRLKKINKHSDNLVALINDLLDIARIESGGTTMKLKKQSIKPTIDNIQDLLAPQAKEKNITFETIIPQDCPDVPFDSSQIERVFINLLSNAIKFTPEGGTISTTIEHDSNKITVNISDNGIGLKKEDISRLFDEFFRVENKINQNVKGTGLGLALVKKIILAHQGEIWVKSNFGEGTTFLFTLPL